MKLHKKLFYRALRILPFNLRRGHSRAAMRRRDAMRIQRLKDREMDRILDRLPVR